MTDQELIDRATALCCAVRRVIAGNTMHGMWDVVFDAEAAIAGLRTLLREPRFDVLEWCADDMAHFLKRTKERG